MTESRPISAAPRAPTNTLARRRAAVLYRALVASGSEGLAWRECWQVLLNDEDLVTEDSPVAIGQVITWMRQKGVPIDALYVAGETRFRLGSRP